MRQQMGTYTAVVGGCRVDLKDPKTQKVLGKEWGVESTNEEFALFKGCLPQTPYCW